MCMFFLFRFLPNFVSKRVFFVFYFRFLQTAPEGERVADGAAFLGSIEERLWRRQDSVSVCVARSFLISTTATASVNVSAQPLNAVARVRPPVRPLGWPNLRTVATSATQCMLLVCRPGAPRIPVMAAASPAGRRLYKIS